MSGCPQNYGQYNDHHEGPFSDLGLGGVGQPIVDFDQFGTRYAPALISLARCALLRCKAIRCVSWIMPVLTSLGRHNELHALVSFRDNENDTSGPFRPKVNCIA
jgi:hypothetical protein